MPVKPLIVLGCMFALCTHARAQEAELAPDLAYGNYQMGYYLSALREATKRIESNPNDAPAMTLLGQLYLEGLGVAQNDTEAVRWFALAAARGNAQAQFALGAEKLVGKGTPQDKKGAAAFHFVRLSPFFLRLFRLPGVLYK